MLLQTASPRIPCWARDTCLLKHNVRRVVILRVQALKKSDKNTRWYDSNLTTTERAEIILLGLQEPFKRCWNADDLDEFVHNMTSILWPDVVYERRAKVLVADEAVNVDHLYIEGANHKSSREMTYRICAIELLADVLDGLEKLQSDGTGTTAQRPQCVINRRELPNWVRCPDLLHAALDERVIEMIKNMKDSKDERDWRLNITTHERAQIIRARIQRRFNRRVIAAVERRRPMGALFCFFDPNFAVNLRPLIHKELKSRHETQSSTWNQTNGVWMMVECVLIGVFEDCEEHGEKVHETRMHRLRDWVRRQVMRKLTSGGMPSRSTCQKP